MAGFPPFLGFVGKELKYEGALAIASEPLFVASAAILANALMVAVAGIVGLRPFFGEPAETPKRSKEPPARMWIGPLLLAGLGLTFGMAPSLIAGTLVQPAVTAVLGRPETVELALWHGINAPLLLSLLTFALGVTIYTYRRSLCEFLVSLESRLPFSGDGVWDRLLEGLKRVAAFQTDLLQSGVLRHYLFIVFSTFVLIMGGTLFAADALRLPQAWPNVLIKEVSVVILIVAGAAMAALTSSRLLAVCALGVVGVGIALVFVMELKPS